jgi:LysR family glycine cleavage system transcriptional activator
VQRGLDLFEAGLTQIKRQKSGRVLTVSMSPSFATKWFVPRIETFRERHPDIVLRIDANARPVDFVTDDVDVAIRYGPGRYAGLFSTLLFEEELFPVCSPQLLERAEPLRDPADLARHTLLHHETANLAGPAPSWTAWFDCVGLQGTVPLDRGVRFTSSLTAVQAALNGQGVLLGRSLIVKDDLAAGRLVRPFPQSCPANFGYHLVYPAHFAGRTALQAFVSWITQEA